VTGFASDEAESISAGDQKAVVVSSQPLALSVEGGGRRALDLDVREADGGFRPAFDLAAVRLGRSVGEGASLLDSGVSLTPVSEQGAVLSGGGAIDHAGVFYGDTEDAGAGARDLSMFAKPTVYGFEWFDVLFGARSPEHLFFKVGLPAGASLTEDASGGVEVHREGVALAVLPRPWAMDAGGVPIEVSVGVAGDVVELSLPRGAGTRYPVLLDPTVEDKILPKSSNACGLNGSNWCFVSEPPEQFKFSGTEESGAATAVGQHMELLYKTRGASKVYRLALNSYSQILHARNTLEIVKNGGGGEENGELLGNNVSSVHNESSLCAKRSESPPSCSTSTETNGNFVRFQQTANEANTNMWSSIASADVYISQEKPPTATFNEKDPKIRIEEPNGTVVERENVLYPGSKGWIGPHSSTAFETIDKDPGVGLSYVAADGGSGWSREVFLKEKEAKCTSVWCPEEYKDKFTYYTTTPEFTSPMPSGEYRIQSYAEDSVKLNGFTYATVRVDAEAPQSIKLAGLPAGNQLSGGVYKIKAEATDSKTGVPSSGVASLKLGIDGAEAAEPRGSCSPGPCTASAEWTIHGGQLSAGAHTLTVVAADNAGNVSHEDFVIFVHHATPVALGPGSLDPQSGNFSLGGSDVSMGPGLTLSRAYSSRNLTAGVEGGLGPQWRMSLAGSESLEELADGSMVLTSADGGETVFEKNAKGEFEAPEGDANVALTAEVNAKGAPVAYYVKSAAAGSTMKFARASGYLQTAPTYYGEIGWEGPGTGQLNTPMGVASDAKGDAWVADTKNDRIEEFDPEGEYVAQFGSVGSGFGALSEPRGVAIDGKGEIWVADTGNNRVEEFTGKGEFMRVAGSEGAGALNEPQGIATDSSGNVWVADTGDNRVVEFNEKGEYEREAGKTIGGRALLEPVGVAVDSSGDAWVTDAKNHRFVEFGPTGEGLKEVGKEGTGNGEFQTPTGIAIDSENDVYVDDYATDRVQEFNAKGEFLTKFGSAGVNGGQFKAAYLMGIDVQGALLVADSENSRVQRWAHSAWLPSVSEGLVATSQVSYTYKAVRAASGTVIEPTEVLAPHASELSCAPTIKTGCRALFLKYAEKTTATGEGESQWGEYEGRLSEVFFAAYNPVTKVVEEKVAVARYSYDAKGRLRAEWDPRVKPEQKTVYGYDQEGHVTAVTPPGQESLGFVYGTIAGDASTGRVLKVTRASASAKLWGGEGPADLEAPKLSGTPAVGVRMAVSNGLWLGEPVVYGYQWEDCNSKGEACTVVLGATNANYTPASGDVGHTLRARVTAVNGGGSVVAESAASSIVVAKAGSYTQTVDSGYSVNAVSCIPGTSTCVLSDSAGKALYATNVSSFSAASWNSWSGVSGESPSEAVACPTSGLCLMAAGEDSGHGGNLYYATSLGGGWTQAYSPAFGVDAISCVSSSLCVDGQIAEGYFRYSTSPASSSWTLESQGSAPMKSVFCLSSSFCAIADGAGSVHMATSTTQIESSSWTSTDVDGTSALNGVACTSTSSCVAIDGAGNVLNLTIGSKGEATASKHDIDGTTGLTGVACQGSSTCAAVDTTGHVFVSKNSGETWTTLYSLGGDLTAVSCASTSLCAATDTTGKVTAFNLTGTGTEGGARGPQPGLTVDYNVPIQGSAAPYQMGENLLTLKPETEIWGQEEDTPVEATAVFPPDSPQGWPAQSYERATISYFDARGRTVNVARPGGGISTSEYNESNDVVRTLSPDNRAVAVKAGAKSVEVANKLDSRSVYNSEGDELLETTGPEHNVKLQVGGEAQARQVVKYSYDEGAPAEGGPYRLPTKTTGAALVAGKEEDIRTTLTSYSGQNNLGWRLRKPTSVTTDPAGLDLTSSTVYDEGTGAVLEARTPAANREVASELNSFFSFGGSGAGAGQLEKPAAVATDSVGNVWVADTGHDRVQEFNSKGEFVREFGAEGRGAGQFIRPEDIAVSPSGSVYVVDNGNSRVEQFDSSGVFIRAFGSSGEGNGQFGSALSGVAVDGGGRVWTVEGGKKERVQEFSAEGSYLSQFGSTGSENGKFSSPKGIAVDPGGNVWVADTGNNRVQEFRPSGQWVRTFGAKGTGNGQFKEPHGVAIGPEGDVWVADTENNRVQRFTSEGSYLSQVGTGGNESGQFYTPKGVATDASGNVWVADTGNNRIQEVTGSEFVRKFGGSGSGAGQLEKPVGVATDSLGNVWVADTGHDRVQEFNAKGEFVREFGVEGSGNGAFKEPRGIAVDGKGDVWVADTGNDRIQEFNSKDEFVRAVTPSEFYTPAGVAVDGEGHVWSVEESFVSHGGRVQEFSPEGVSLLAFGKEGTGNGEFKRPAGIAVDSKSYVWVADTENNRVQEFKPSGEFVRAFGGNGSGGGQFKAPRDVAIDPEGDVWVADTGNNRLQRFSSEGLYLSQAGTIGNENGQFAEPKGLAIDSSGNVWVADTVNNRIQELTGSEFVRVFGGAGSGAGQLEKPAGAATDSSGNMWVVDTGHDRVQEFGAKGEFVREFGAPGSGSGAFREPHGIAVSPSGKVYVADTGNSRVQEFGPKGEFVRAFGRAGTGNGEFEKLQGVAIDAEGHVWTIEQGYELLKAGKDRVQEFTSEGAYIAQFGKEGTSNGLFMLPKGIAVDSKGNVWVADTGNNRVQEFKPSGEFVRVFGSEGAGNGQFKEPAGVTVGPDGDVWVIDTGNDRVQRFSGEGGYLDQVGTVGNQNGQFAKPEGLATDNTGRVIAADTNNNRIQVFTPASPFIHETRTVYYSARPNASYPTCGGHVEWEGMPCSTRPGAQPAGSRAPSLPTTTVESYNMWGEPETTTETFPERGSFKETTRTKKIGYDEAGRPTSSEEASTSTIDKALPKVTATESIGQVCGQTKTVRCVTQSATEGETTYTITSIYDTLGRLVSYTDADKNTTTYEYESSGEGRLLAVSDAKGYQDYAYDPTTGMMTKLLDSGAKTFTAGYDVEGNMTTETYPNGMTVTYTRDQAGAATGIEYVKTTHCSEKCVWFSETTAPSIHGETVSRAGTLTSDAYAYDAAGRLVQASETPAGKGCTIRVYGYDEESNRRSLTTREPGLEGKCATEGGTSETHSYDEANRLIDTGVVYDPLGNTTKLPAGDAGGYELTSSFYVDGQVEKQTQNGQENTYSIDPSGRVRKSVGKGTSNVTAISHYAGVGGALSWKDEEAGKYTRLIPGPDGSLCGTETNGEAPVLQLHDLQGDIVATAALAETETKLLNTYNSTEFGVPSNGTPPTKYSWLGASAVSSELSSGALVTGTVAYQPQLGRALQTQAVIPPGIAVGGATQTPAYHAQVSAWEIASGNEAAKRHAEEGATEERAAQQEAEEAVKMAEMPEMFEMQYTSAIRCTGGQACAASAGTCKLGSKFGQLGDNGILELTAEVRCSRTMAGIKFRLCFQVEWEDQWLQYECSGNEGVGVVKNTSDYPAIRESVCAQGLNYRAFAWAFAWARGVTWKSANELSKPWRCAGNYAESVQEFLDNVKID
jgi:YD repeat-containing protein